MLGTQSKKPGAIAGLSFSFHGLRALLRRRLGHGGLERLVGLLRHARIDLAELGRLRNEVLVSRLHVLALHLDRLVERLGTKQLLGRRGAVLKRLPGIVGHLDRNSLEALRQGTERRERRVHVVLSELLHVLEVLDHGVTLSRPLAAAWGFHCTDFVVSLSPPWRLPGHGDRKQYIALHKNVKPWYRNAKAAMGGALNDLAIVVP